MKQGLVEALPTFCSVLVEVVYLFPLLVVDTEVVESVKVCLDGPVVGSIVSL